MYQSSSETRIAWLQSLRLVTIGVGLALLLLAVEESGFGARLSYAVLLGAGLLTLLYLAIGRRVERPGRFASGQIAVDLVLITALVYLTGGVYSFATILYFGAVLAAALCVSRQVGFLAASAATVGLAGIQIAYYLAAMESPLLELPYVDAEFVIAHRLRLGRETAYLLAQGLGLHTVAALGSYLARELQHVRILYSEILERMGDGLIVVDQRRSILFVNHEARRLLGYRKLDSVVGRKLEEVFRRRQDLQVLDGMLSADPTAFEVEVETRTGPRAFHVKTTVLKDGKGIVRGTIGLFTDLTLRRQAEESARRAERLEELTTLALGIAHEVRNPLASIRGCVQELARADGLAPADREQLTAIVCRESDRLDRILTDFLRFAKMRPPILAPCDLVKLLRDTAVLLRSREGVGADRVALELPEAASALADAAQLQQVFLNLGLNALEAMGPKGTLHILARPARVAVTGSLEGRGLRRSFGETTGFEVVFEDDGPGIPERDRPQVFVPFFTTKPSGTGLGLPVAERIVKAHGGEIAVEARPEGGTRFLVRLPSKAREGPDPGPSPDEAARGAAGALAPRGAHVPAAISSGSKEE